MLGVGDCYLVIQIFETNIDMTSVMVFRCLVGIFIVDYNGLMRRLLTFRRCRISSH